MSITCVLSGPGTSRAQAESILRQSGADNVHEDPHGHSIEDGEAVITCDLPDLSITTWPAADIPPAIEQVGWRLRGHWETTGRWSKVGDPITLEDKNDAKADLARLKAQLRAAGIVLPED